MSLPSAPEIEDCALLVARDDGSAAGLLPLVVALHARGGDAASALAWARTAFGAGPDIVAAQAARPCNPLQSNLQSAGAYAGFSWYLGDDPSHPEAASFGDALAQVSLLVAGLRRDCIVAGRGQGGVLATTLALYATPWIAGIYVEDASVPAIEGWTPPDTDRGAISVFLPAPGDCSRLAADLRRCWDEVIASAAGFGAEDWLRRFRARLPLHA